MSAVIGTDVHIFGAVLSCARAKTVQTERIFVCGRAVIVVIFAACVKLAINKLPVIASFFFVVIKGNSTSEIFNFNRMIGKNSDVDYIAVAFTRFVNRV